MAGVGFVACGKRSAQTGRFVRDADGADAVTLGQTQRNFKQTRQHVHVFVAVEMCWLDSGRFHFFDLRVPLLLDFAKHDVALGDAQQQRLRAAIELRRRR